MSQKVFTDESLETFVDEIKSYVDDAVSKKANTSHTHSISNVTNLQSTLDGKQATVTGGASTITSSNLTTNRALISNSSGKVAVSAVTSTELGYLDGVTSNVQTQLDGKAASSHTHSYAGSSSAGGAATSANKLNTDAGSATQPVYFSGGVPKATTYTLGKSVPSNAVFTDTHYASKNVVGATNATSNTATALSNGAVYLNSVENGAVTSSHKISGSGATTVTTDTSGNIIISSTDNNTTYNAAGSALGLVMSGGDVTISSGVITVNDDSHNHTIANVDNLQSSLDAKQATITGGATTITGSNLTASRALVSNSSGKVAVSDVTSTELGYLDGVKSNVQTQLDGKAASSHNHAASNITSGTLSSDILPTVPISKGGTGATTAAAALTNLGITATATELNYVDGVTSAIQTQLNNKAASSHTHNYAGSSSAGGAANSANKLATARTIELGTGVTGTATSFNGTANITIPVTDVKESYLSWGGKSLTGSVSPIGAALSTEHSANRLAYLNPAAVTVEYSNDAGSTWTDSGLADSSKINFVTTSNAISVGSNSTVTTSHRTRVTLTAQNGTTGYVYTRPRKMLINVSTAGHGLTVTIEAKTGASDASWTTLGTYTLNGWSGWNDIPMSIGTFGGGTNQTSNYWYMRLTFATTSVSSSYTTTKSSIIGLRLFGDTCWTRTSNMGETGHLYSYDYQQNATFPAKVTANTFVGALSGNATTATTANKLGSSTVGGTAKPIYLNSGTATACSSTVGSATQPVYMNGGTITACTYTLGKSVPSNAVFTDTNTKVTNTLATTTKAYVTGTTSASTNTGTQVFDTGVYLDTTAGQLTAATFNGTTFSGSGVATLAEVKSYLGI